MNTFIFHYFSVVLIKEECQDLGSDSFGQIKTRIYSPLHKKYICFAPNGRVRAVVNKTGLDWINQFQTFLTGLTSFIPCSTSFKICSTNKERETNLISTRLRHFLGTVLNVYSGEFSYL